MKNSYMNKGLLMIGLLLVGVSLQAQWATSGSTVTTTGNVGVGTTTPGTYNNTNQSGAPSYDSNDRIVTIYSSASRPVLELARPVSSLSAGQLLGAIFFSNADGQSDQHRQAAGIWAERSSYTTVPSLAGANLIFMTKVGAGGKQNKMYFDTDGNLGIGAADTKGYRLAVAGKAIAEEVVVKLQANWPDYVFSDAYRLLSLSELSAYLQINKHLPGLPSASEVEKDGVELGKLNTVLVEKIEEITLYLIELEKKNKDLEARIVQLETKN